MSENLISIITPTYNRAWCIERTIKSVFDQTYNNWELLIIDDGSTDNTENIMNKYLEEGRIRYFKCGGNEGVHFARNRGIDKAKGECIVFLDSDDELKPTALETINYEFNKLDNDKIGVLIFNAEDNAGNIDGKYPKKNMTLITFKDLIKGNIISGEKFGVVKASVFKDENLRFPELPGQMERILWHSICKYYDFLFINKSIRIYHTEHDDRLTGTGQTVQKAKHQSKLYEIFFEKFEYDYILYNPKKLSYLNFEKAINEILSGKTKEGRASIKKAITYNNRKILIGICIYLLSYLPNKIFTRLTLIGHRFKKILH